MVQRQSVWRAGNEVEVLWLTETETVLRAKTRRAAQARWLGGARRFLDHVPLPGDPTVVVARYEARKDASRADDGGVPRWSCALLQPH